MTCHRFCISTLSGMIPWFWLTFNSSPLWFWWSLASHHHSFNVDLHHNNIDSVICCWSHSDFELRLPTTHYVFDGVWCGVCWSSCRLFWRSRSQFFVFEQLTRAFSRYAGAFLRYAVSCLRWIQILQEGMGSLPAWSIQAICQRRRSVAKELLQGMLRCLRMVLRISTWYNAPTDESCWSAKFRGSRFRDRFYPSHSFWRTSADLGLVCSSFYGYWFCQAL